MTKNFSLDPLKEQLGPYLNKAKAFYDNLSQRELSLIGGACLLGLFFLAVFAYDSISSVFSEQSKRIALTMQLADTTPTVIDRYLKVKLRHDKILEKCKSAGSTESARSYLESLLTSKAGLKDFRITQGQKQDFGENCQQVPYGIRFQTPDLNALVEFLKEVVEGSRPFTLSTLRLLRNRGTDRVDVEMDVSSIDPR